MNSGLMKKIGMPLLLALTLAPKVHSLDIKCKGDLAVDFFHTTGDVSLSESARTVPIHPDDTYANPKNNGPIEDVLTGLSFQNVKLRIGAEATHNNFIANFGLGAGIAFVTYNTEYDFAERNYTNNPGTDQRGYGAALTNYFLQGDGTAGLLFNPFIRLGYKIKTKPASYTDINLFTEYSPEFISFNTDLKTGWDRYDRFEEFEKRTVKTSFTNHFIKVGIGMPSKTPKETPLGLTPEIYVGLGIPQFTKEEQGITFSNSLCFGVTLKVDMNRLLPQTPKK